MEDRKTSGWCGGRWESKNGKLDVGSVRQEVIVEK
jgi:hypothetical protein